MLVNRLWFFPLSVTDFSWKIDVLCAESTTFYVIIDGFPGTTQFLSMSGEYVVEGLPP